MTPTSSRSTTFHQPSEQLHSRLAMYSIAAGAAGVGLLALASPASAEIIYTHANVRLRGNDNQNYYLSLTNGQTTDFILRAFWTPSTFGSGGVSGVSVSPAMGNGAGGSGGSAAALAPGDVIDGDHKFAGTEMAWMKTFFGSDFGAGGRWKNVKNGYLGLKFKIDGETHYGWARLTIRNQAPLTAVLTGYAYETEPNTPIVAGQTSGTDRAPSASAGAADPNDGDSSSTLGTLAMGAVARFNR